MEQIRQLTPPSADQCRLSADSLSTTRLAQFNLIRDVYRNGGGRDETFLSISWNSSVNFCAKSLKNIARGTTDPEIDSETWTKLGDNMAPLALIANLATRWRHLTFSHLITFYH